MSSPKVKSKPTKRPKIKYIAIPGKRCRFCGQVYMQPFCNDPYDFYGKIHIEPGQHTGPFECIEHLSSVIEDLRSDIKSLQDIQSGINEP